VIAVDTERSTTSVTSRLLRREASMDPDCSGVSMYTAAHGTAEPTAKDKVSVRTR